MVESLTPDVANLTENRLCFPFLVACFIRFLTLTDYPKTTHWLIARRAAFGVKKNFTALLAPRRQNKHNKIFVLIQTMQQMRKPSHLNKMVKSVQCTSQPLIQQTWQFNYSPVLSGTGPSGSCVIAHSISSLGTVNLRKCHQVKLRTQLNGTSLQLCNCKYKDWN